MQRESERSRWADWPDLREQEQVHGRPGLGEHSREKAAYAHQDALRKTVQRGGIGPGTANARMAQYHEERKRAQKSLTLLQQRTRNQQQVTSTPLHAARKYSKELTLHLTPNGAEDFMLQIPKVKDASRGTPGLTSLEFEEYRPAPGSRRVKATASYSTRAARDMSYTHNYRALLEVFLNQLGPDLLALFEDDLDAR